MKQGQWRGEPVAVNVSKVRKSFGARRVLRDFTLSVSGGEVVAVTGANGSGKSTLLKIVAGLIRPTGGAVTIAVGPVDRTESADRRASVGYAAPDLMLYGELTARENLRFFDAVRGRREESGQNYENELNWVGLGGRGDDPVATFSSGMRQRLRLAFAARAAAPVLLLDEPSLALDAEGVGLVARLIADQRTRGGVTLLATNDAREAALGDRSVGLGS